MSVFERVLVGLRGGDADQEQLVQVARIAGPGAQVRALHVVDLPRQGIYGGQLLEWHERMVHRIADRFRGQLTAELKSAPLEGRRLSIALRDGRPALEIMRAADEWDADLLVAGGGEKTGLDAIGSETMTLIQHSSRPVLVTGRDPAVETVLVPVNFSDLSRRALRLGAALARQLEVPLRVIHVVTTSWSDYPELSAQEWWDTPYAGTAGTTTMRAHVADHLDEVARKEIGEEPLSFAAEVIEGADPGARIAEEAGRLPRPLIVLGSLGRRARHGLLMGSTALRVIQHCSCSTLTFKEDGFRSDLGGEEGVLREVTEIE